MIGGDRGEELARLRGELEAVEKTAIAKNCTDILRAPQEEPRPETDRRSAPEGIARVWSD